MIEYTFKKQLSQSIKIIHIGKISAKMRFFILLTELIGILMIPNSFATILECDFKYKNTVWGAKYACVVVNLRTSLSDRHVTEVKGNHSYGKSNYDVTKLYAEKQFCPYLPLNLSNYFENLQTFYIKNSNVQHLINGDLDGLTKLEVFDVSHNPIEQLGRDFFPNQSSIDMISFYDCHLKIIDPKSLDTLTNLREAHFQMNVCLDYNADDKSKLDDLKAEITDKCTYHHDERILKGTNALSQCINTRNDSNQSSSHGIEYTAISCLSLVIIIMLAYLFKHFLRNRLNWNSNHNNNNDGETLL